MTKTQDKCAQCGCSKESHRNGYCYHYSDEDTDYFHNDRKFISEQELKGKKYSRAFNGKIIIEHLSDAIVEVLKVWGTPNAHFDAMWHGYETLVDDLQVKGHNTTVTSLKKEMKKLKSSGIVELKSVYDYDYKINGRGWFLCEPKTKQS